MKLIDLVVQELPKRGGWPDEVMRIAQDGHGALWGADCSNLYRILTGVSLPVSSDYCFVEVTREQYEAAVQQSVWDGKGLPAVGTECEFMKHERHFTFWRKGIIKYISKYTCVIDVIGAQGEFIAHPVTLQFRPIRTEAQCAIDKMVELSGVTVGAAKILYDAGYRK